MDEIQERGHDLIIWMQQFSPTLDGLFKVITTLGAEQVFLLLLPLVFWCLDKRRGARLGVLLMLSAYVNHALKDLFGRPRPSPNRIKVMAEEISPGLPSGHSQNSVAVYGFLAAWMHRPRAWVGAGLIVFGVGLSRIYLGVHFPSDVLGGWLVGIVLLAIYLRVEPEVEHRLRTLPWGYQIVLTVVAPLTLFFLNASKDSAQLMGVLAGMMAGVLIELRWVHFSVEGSLLQRALRFCVGSGIMLVVWLGSKAIFPSEPEMVALVFRLLRYGLVGVWASLGAPWLFVRAGLAPRESKVGESPACVRIASGQNPRT